LGCMQNCGNCGSRNALDAVQVKFKASVCHQNHTHPGLRLYTTVIQWGFYCSVTVLGPSFQCKCGFCLLQPSQKWHDTPWLWVVCTSKLLCELCCFQLFIVLKLPTFGGSEWSCWVSPQPHLLCKCRSYCI